MSAILLLCRPFGLEAQEPAASYIAQTWTADDGLPATEVSALLQSRDGYLWIGTPGGVARFDGDRFVTLRKSEAPGLTSNRILSLCNDGHNGIWIGTDGGGLTHYAPDSPELTPRLQGLSSMTILSVLVDDHGDLWAGSDAGLNFWEGARFVPYLKVDGLPDETVTAIVRDPGHGLLIGTAAGLGQFADGKLKPFDSVPALPQRRVTALAVQPDGGVWIGTDNGLYNAERHKGKATLRRVCADPVTSILKRSNGETWFGSSDGNLRSIQPGGPAPLLAHKFNSPPRALMEDQEHNVWVGTSQGLTRLTKRQFFFRGSPSAQEVVSYYAATNGAVAQVFRNGRADFAAPHSEPSTNWFPASVLAKTVDGCGPVLWVGTSGEGLWRWDGQNLRIFGQRQGLSDIFIETLCVSGPNSVWVGTRNGGLNHITEAGIRRFLTPWGFTGSYASAIMEDSTGTLWIATTGDGLFCLRNGVFTAHTTLSGLPDDTVTSLIVEPDGTVWAGTARGLGFWNGRRWHAFSSKNGVSEEAIDQMQDDANGHLWLGCGPNIYRFSKAELIAVAEGEKTTAYPVPYGSSDGLEGASMVEGAQISRNTRKDQICFTTTRGLLVFNPERFELNTNIPPVLIQEVLIGSESVSLAGKVEAPPGQRTIQFRYTAMSFAAPEKILFRCMLSGFDSDWVEVGKSRTMRYTRLPPGTYRFRVTACNNDGFWNEAGAIVMLTIPAFWWETAWFRIGAVLLVGVALAGFVRLRRQRRHEIEQLRLRIAGDLHDEIGSSLWSITLLSKMLQQGENLAEEDRRDVGEIHRIASQTSNALRDIVWLINPGLDTLQDMVLRMRDFLSATVRGLNAQVHTDQADLSRKLSLEMRQSFFLVFKESVTNVAKHANAKRLDITLAEVHGVLEMRVRDDGVGFDPATTKRGHGLQSLKRRAETVGGWLEIHSKPGKGTEVILRAELGHS